MAVLGLAFLLLGVSAPSANGAEPKRILFVNSFASGTSPFAPFNSAFREHMLRAWPAQVAFYEVSLDGWRPGNKENEDALVQVMRSRFSDLPMDLVVARGLRAGQFYIRHRDELFPNAPLMVTGDEASLPSAELRPGDSFVANRVPSVQVVTSLLKLLPDTSTIAVVFGKSAPEQYWVSRLKDEFAPLAGRVRFVWLDHLSLPEMRQRVATLEPGTVVLFGLLIRRCGRRSVPGELRSVGAARRIQRTDIQLLRKRIGAGNGRRLASWQCGKCGRCREDRKSDASWRVDER